MDNEKLQRGNELVEIIKEIKDFLSVFPDDSSHFGQCQIRVLYNVPLSAEVKSSTIIADLIPRAFFNLRAHTKEALARYEKEFEEL